MRSPPSCEPEAWSGRDEKRRKVVGVRELTLAQAPANVGVSCGA
jgi:hypothetical protein